MILDFLGTVRADLDVEMSVMCLLPVEPHSPGVLKVSAALHAVERVQHGVVALQQELLVHPLDVGLQVLLGGDLLAAVRTYTHPIGCHGALRGGHDLGMDVEPVLGQVVDHLLAHVALLLLLVVELLMFLERALTPENLLTLVARPRHCLLRSVPSANILQSLGVELSPMSLE